MSAAAKVRAEELERLVARAFVASNVSAHNAALVAHALIKAEIDGQKGHGLSRVASYAAQARAGKVDGHSVPVAVEKRAGALCVDARHGFAYPAFALALARLPAMARHTGIAAAAITRSHHFGVAGHHAEALADQGLVALVLGNTPAAMAMPGGKRGLLGTNPIAFAAPRKGASPVVVDMALSEVARGKILAASQAGKAIPLGWAVDADGRPTTDAKAALAGTLLPAGGAKGAALAFMVEVLAVALTGANYAFEATSFLDDQGGPPGVGQILIAIDPDAFAGGEVFAARLGVLAGAIEADGGRVPGVRRIALRATAARDGIGVEPAVLDALKALADG